MTRAVARHLVPPAGEDMRVVQGTIRSWSSTTFANVVDIDGQNFTDLPVASGVEALTYQAGDVVLVEQWFPGGKKGELGLGTAWIRGRVIIPGTGAAEQAIGWMQTTLAKQIVDELVEQLLVSPAGQALAAFVFAQRVRTGSVEDFESRASTDYGDLTTPGPTVTDVPVSESGEAVVIVGCANQANPDAGAGSSGGLMSFAISGATTRAADDADSMRCVLTNHNSEGPNQTSTVRASMGVVVTGLNPGLHTFTAKYRAFSPDRPGLFANRNLMVIGL